MDNDFQTALNNWLDAVRVKVIEPAHASWAMDHKGVPYQTLEVDPLQKFVRIWSITYGGGKSSWAFVALADGQSGAMGQWKRGDIFKCDGWKKPAKHARGNIFDTSNGATCNVVQWTGPSYLR